MTTYFIVQYKGFFSNKWIDSSHFNIANYDNPQIALNEAIKYVEFITKDGEFDKNEVRIIKTTTEIVYSY